MSKAGRVPKTISAAILRNGSCYSAKVSSFRLFGKSTMTAGCFLRFEWKAECDPFLRQGVSTLQSLTGYTHPKKIAAFVSTSRDCQSYSPLPPFSLFVATNDAIFQLFSSFLRGKLLGWKFHLELCSFSFERNQQIDRYWKRYVHFFSLF